MDNIDNQVANNSERNDEKRERALFRLRQSGRVKDIASFTPRIAVHERMPVAKLDTAGMSLVQTTEQQVTWMEAVGFHDCPEASIPDDRLTVYWAEVESQSQRRPYSGAQLASIPYPKYAHGVALSSCDVHNILFYAHSNAT